MGSYKIGQVDILLGIDHAADKAKFGEGYGVGERLREQAVAGKLEDSELAELIRTKILLVVSQAGFAGGDHVVDIVGVRRRGVDFDPNRPIDALIDLLLEVIS